MHEDEKKVERKKDLNPLPKSMIEMLEIIESSINKEMELDASPHHLAKSAVVAVCDVMGGCTIYLPRGTALKRKLRSEAIYSDFLNGMAHEELIRKYAIASQTVYDIITDERALSLEARFKH
ncbi:hypothetical protein PS900_06186 [Pseudomonas fluorescens]|uniref:Mor transcription activator domain-containing protein n=2 Tax=Pseudomonas fluorescens TaxID=294 RepID=A0A8H2NYR9_PSEFL|nr:hypothetical protein PS900_06186 [Pseudomonas fluorescens]